MMTIERAHRLLKDKKISASELARAYVDAVRRDDPTLHAYITVTEDVAIEAARHTDERIVKGEMLGALDGIPFILKDNITTSGILTSCASRMLSDYIPCYDAAVWAFLKNAGAVLLGKGNMDEFAMGSASDMSYYGAVTNPHDTSRVAGGSSGGSAAAVAAGLAVFGIGSDTGGSVRQPASLCGIVGLKPTYGKVSRCGLVAFGSSLDQIGTLTSTVRDATTVLDIISGHDGGDMTYRDTEPVGGALTASVKGKKIGIAREYFDALPDDIASAVNGAVDVYKKLGAEITPLSIPTLKYSLQIYYIIACAEASSNLGRFDGIRYGFRASDGDTPDEVIRCTRTQGFGEEVRRRIMIGTYVLSAGYRDNYYKKALGLREMLRSEFRDAFGKCDFLIAPTSPVTAIKSGAKLSPVEKYQNDICTVSPNLAGLPAVSLPCGFDDEGMPAGMQIIGRHFDEAGILSAALAFENECGAAYVRDTKWGVRL